ncbi:ricin B lectin domain-containing protein [Radiomyces spectabilis]|uniref:ricin B lectin domain-containing protein n=1 Tax=Radiomyces spectabilis TaxID=64574 RepID=UPI002220D0A5|nr:ricin B lectin domain-containing protein [Radiomyces spectabilis]KAI8374293.1 ricin B lectin domain-containing protein [Radiomyces spectabilis]
MVQYIPQGQFFIVSKFNGRVLDVEGASTKDGAKICVWQKKESDNANQLWEYRNGFFVNANSGKVLDVKGGKIKHDSHVIQYAQKDIAENVENQRWLIDHQGYIHTSADPKLVLDIRGAEDKDGAEVILYEKREGTASSNQQWDLVPGH